ncbi:hypothetical protein JTE90_007262 [Oedothorax gibbosus]|uniref:Uncharacterized protein n=1 Tax=Oedothorax gibbosus TaxID=931172 RepID=A0AAV6VN54_9ARAC|nr:hypothetical protein JTE90_007262 [Oedothorax gibbosus]
MEWSDDRVVVRALILDSKVCGPKKKVSIAKDSKSTKPFKHDPRPFPGSNNTCSNLDQCNLQSRKQQSQPAGVDGMTHNFHLKRLQRTKDILKHTQKEVELLRHGRSPQVSVRLSVWAVNLGRYLTE